LTEATFREIKVALHSATTPQLLGKRIAYADQPFVVTPEQSDYWWSKRWSTDSKSKGSSVGFADIPVAGMGLRTGDPILTIMACNDSIDGLRLKLIGLVDR
jgi:predicted ATP-grasp superfamily ATP-dependent carboligase